MSLFLDDGDVRLYHGDALETLKTLPSESVHMCVTSPPFYGLRDYGVTGQIGLEETPEQWVDNLVQVFREVRRVLRPEGTLWLEVGDSYASNPAGNKTPSGFSQTRPSRQKHGVGPETVDLPKLEHGCKPKDLIGAPWLLAFALRADGWYLRSDIVWARPNPMPESVTDRPTKSHSYVFLLAKQPRYFFDQEAVRETALSTGYESADLRSNDPGWSGNPRVTGQKGHPLPGPWTNGAGRNVRSVWNIPTQPYPEAHFATFPKELARRCILAGTSERGACPECGVPWVRETITEHGPDRASDWAQRAANGAQTGGVGKNFRDRTTQTLGWRPSCNHKPVGSEGLDHPGIWEFALPPVPCVVLDPFVGSGTVPHVARKHGRHAIGIDLNAQYLELAGRRLQQLSLFAQVQP